MKFNREIFFQLFRQKLIGRLDQNQVDGLNFLLDSFENYSEYWTDTRKIAYALATVMHETASTFQPIAEYGKGRGKTYGTPDKRTGKTYYGRGFVQLTWIGNYLKADTNIKRRMPELAADFQRKTGQKLDLVNQPDQAMNHLIAFAVMTLGMHEGWFRPGNDLDRYINNAKTDYIYARLIINGIPKGEKLPDKAELIASYAKRFEAILRVSKIETPLQNNQFTDLKDSEINVTIPAASRSNPPDAQPANDGTPNLADSPTPADTAPPETQGEGGQVAENITNVNTGDKTVPENFSPETKPIDAPPPSGILSKAKVWIATIGLGVPTLSGVTDSVKNYLSNDQFNYRDSINVAMEVAKFVFPYVVYLAIAFVALWAIKEVLKQISFIVNQYTLARSDMHDVEVVPFKEQPKGGAYQWMTAKLAGEKPAPPSITESESK